MTSQERRTISVKARTHSRVTSLSDGFDDSADKILNRLVDFWHKYKSIVEKLDTLEEFYDKYKDRVDELENKPSP